MTEETKQADTENAADQPTAESAAPTKGETPEGAEGQSEGVAAAVAEAPATEAPASEAPASEAPASEAPPAETAAEASPATEQVAQPADPVAQAEASPATSEEPVAAPAAEATPSEAALAAEAQADAPPADTAAEATPASAADQPAAAPPQTMAELLDTMDTEIMSPKHGDVVEGTIVRIDPDEILVDFGGKSEGVVSNRELMGRRQRESEEQRPELKIGDQVLVYVLQPESPEGHAVLSLRRAGLERKWRAMQERFEAGEIVEAKVIDHNKGGLIVDLGVRGFVPISQIVDFPRRPRDEQPRDAAQEIAEKLQPFVGRTLRLKILEVNRKANRLILSEKVALYEERREKRDELFSSLQVGQRVKGVVRSIAPFGVFVDLGGIDGLVHKSELSWNKVNNPETAHSIGDNVEAEVIDINHERGRISLSIRRLQPDPWQESVSKYKIGDIIEGTVTKLVNFGAFVRVEEGLEGLIHISELSMQRVAHPGDVVKEGEVVRLRIISLESDRHRLGLSLKQAVDRPAPAASPRYDDRPRRERRDHRRDRGYRPEDAVREPDEGIDNTMAAAFAESGLLDQFRANEQAPAEAPATEASAEAAVADEKPAPAEEPAEEPAAEAKATAEVEAAPTEEAAPEAEKPDAEPEPAEAEAAPAEAEAALAEEPAAEVTATAEVEAAPAEEAAPEAEKPDAEAGEPAEAAKQDEEEKPKRQKREKQEKAKT